MYLSSADEEFWGKGPAWSADARELGALVGIGIRHFVMADNDDLPADLASGPPVAGMMHLPPGAYIPRHSHGSHRFEVVVQGSYEVDGRVVGPGDVMVSRAGEMYGPMQVGPDGVLTVEVFSSPAGVGAETPEEDLSTKSLLTRLRSGTMTPEEREAAMEEYADRIRAHYKIAPAAG
jgi:hypothetical protein